MSFKPKYILAEEAEERIVALYRKEIGDAAEIFNTAIDACQSIILDMYDNASAEVEPVKHGRWREYNYPGQECVYCSACKTEYYPDDLIVIGVNDYPYYCPNCGARMDLEGEEA